MSENKKSIFKEQFSWLSIVFGAVQLAVLFLPASFINDIISYKTTTAFSLFIMPILFGAFSLIAVLSDSVKESAYKWILSIPFTFVLWLYLVNIDFHIRSLNWIFPDYGEPSAGGNFAGFVRLIISAIIILCSVIIGVCTSRSIKSPKLQKIIFVLQKILCSAVCAAILIAIFALDIIMPEYNPVYG